ncbi:MAG: hypothetical protein ACI3ZQ_03460 [Candidatus Cryptobacteroides sp.]
MLLTSILSAVCALALSATAVQAQADTVDLYIINGEKVTNFDGSQLVGKTVSDYKIMTATSSSNGVVTVTKVHNILTDGRQARVIAMTSSATDGANVNSVTVDDSVVDYSVTGVPSDKMELYIDGKKSTRVELGKIKPDKIASITVLKAGSKEAVELTEDETVNVMKVELKKK